MQCANCGFENEDGRKFCGECGQELAWICGNCQTPNTAANKFCGECGTSRAGPLEGPGNEVEAIAVERRFVSVLFADLVGYTPFSEKSDPEDVREFLTDYFDRSQEVIERFGGTVDKFIGDAVMAVWGAVVASDDDAERAVRAGLELVDVVAKQASDAGVPELALRVGVLSGEASVGPGGNEKGLVVGDLVNTASRLQSIAEPGSVLVGESTVRSISGSIAFEPVGDKELKGKSTSVPAFRALTVLSERGGQMRSEALEPPFVGRVDELRMLKDLLSSVSRDKRARLVSMIGEGGIGKSRLVWELRKYVDGVVEQVLWHEGRSPAYGDGVTFWAVKEMIHRRAGIAETDDDDIATDALDKCLEEFLSPDDANWVRPRLQPVIGIGEAPPGDRAEIDAAVRLFFNSVAATGTTVLVFEDLQWADPALLDFVEELCDWSPDYPILVITLARPDLLDKRPQWGTGKRSWVSMNLGSLTDSEIAELVAGAVPGTPADVVDAIVARSGGIPLFAVELIRTLLATEELLDDGSFVGDLDSLAVPESIQAAISARLDRLEADQRMLIQDAAVLGHAFTIEGLAAVTRSKLEDLEIELNGLARRDLIEPVRDPKSPERGQYRFVQSLIRDVAKGRLSRDARRERHLAAANYMKGLDEPELAPVIADHYLHAYQATPEGPQADKLRAEALATLEAALQRAESLRSYEQVMTIGTQALDLAADTPEKALLWEPMAEAASKLDRGAEAERYATLALDHAEKTGSDADVHRLVGLIGRIYLDARALEQATEFLSDRIEPDSDLALDPFLLASAAELARAYSLSLRDSEAFDTAERVLAAAELRNDSPIFAHALITKGTVLSGMGRPREANVVLRGAIDVADRHEVHDASIRGRINLGFAIHLSNTKMSVHVTREALDIARKVGDKPSALSALYNLIASHSWQGNIDDYDSLIDDPLLDDASDWFKGQVLAARARLANYRGAASEARDFAVQSDQLLMSHGDERAKLDAEAFRLARSVWQDDSVAPFQPLLKTAKENLTQYYRAADGLKLAVLLSGRQDLLSLFVALHDEPYLLGGGYMRRVVKTWAAAASGDLNPLDDTLEVLAEHKLKTPTVETLAAVANFLPEGHPEAAPLLNRAFDQCTAEGWHGLRDLIESHVKVT
ncbi:MAG: adenylate/guanylate cyclase domain-containing protein [Acidimicrobiia bacterium]